MEMTRIEAIKAFFNAGDSAREVTNDEIMALRAKIEGADVTYLHWLGDECLKALGATLKMAK